MRGGFNNDENRRGGELHTRACADQAPSPPGALQNGFTLVGMLFAIVFAGIALALAAQIWSTLDRRAREKQLLFAGNQFREALSSYFEQSPGQVKNFPRRLEDLLRDNRYPGVRRHLRKIYFDPMTGRAEWGLKKNEKGEITGIFSLSPGKPMKKGGFEVSDAAFADSLRYSDWVFELRPSASYATAGATGISAAGPSSMDASAASPAAPVQTESTGRTGQRPQAFPSEYQNKLLPR